MALWLTTHTFICVLSPAHALWWKHSELLFALQWFLFEFGQVADRPQVTSNEDKDNFFIRVTSVTSTSLWVTCGSCILLEPNVSIKCKWIAKMFFIAEISNLQQQSYGGSKRVPCVWKLYLTYVMMSVVTYHKFGYIPLITTSNKIFTTIHECCFRNSFSSRQATFTKIHT